MTPRAKPFGALMPVPTAVPPRGSSPTRGSVASSRSIAVLDLRGVPAELLAERHGRGVHEVRAAGLHDALEPALLAAERLGQVLEGRHQLDRDAPGGGEVDGRREHVVRRLRGVDLVVRVHPPPEPLRRQCGDHLVGVHVRRRARPGLEHVDGEVVVPGARRHLGGRVVDGRRDVGGEHLQATVHDGRRALDRWPGPRSATARCAGR